MTFPFKCARCGLCCLAKTCSLGVQFYALTPGQQCPALRFEAGVAVCGLVADHPSAAPAFGIGAGCCMAARVFTSKGMTEWAPLPVEFKRNFVQKHIEAKGGT